MRQGNVTLEAVAMLLLGAALVAGFGDGWRGELFGVTVSIRGAGRPVLLAALFLGVRVALRQRSWRAGELSDLCTRVVGGAVLSAAILSWLTHLTPYVGGADSYGYVSAAARIRAGSLIQHEPVAELLPYPDAIVAATPLGYVPTARAVNANVPAYPLGLPAVMALASIVGGESAPFGVAPLMGVVLIAVCCTFVYQRSGELTLALIAGAAIAFHPVVFAYAIQPMSDVPAAAFFVSALVLLLGDQRAGGRSRTPAVRELLAALAANAAFLIRPALLPGAAALALIPLVQRRGVSRGSVFAATIAAGVAIQFWLQWYLYGDPLASGYGPASELFSLGFLAANARSYAYWLAVVHHLLWFVALGLALALIGRRGERLLVAIPLLVASAPYAVYRTYDHWETLRFVLPLLVIATIAAVGGVFVTGRRINVPAGNWLAVGLLLMLVSHWVGWLDREQVFKRAVAEERFARAGDLVQRVTPEDAVVIASLHSGSVRYYARRETLDWAKIPRGAFAATIGALQNAGRAPFVLIDGEEERMHFEALHGTLDSGTWLPGGQVRDVRLYEARR